jgi:hypothetical protein
MFLRMRTWTLHHAIIFPKLTPNSEAIESGINSDPLAASWLEQAKERSPIDNG